MIKANFSKKMLNIILTGGICSGKSLAASLFVEKNVPVIDADDVVRIFLAPTTLYSQKIIEHFGSEILDDPSESDPSQKKINRKKLSQIIFNDVKAKDWIEKLLHSAVLKEMQDQASRASAPYVIFVIPILVEVLKKGTKIPWALDRVLVVEANENIQKERLQKRDHLTSEFIEKILKAQSTSEERLKIADDVIYNNGSIEDLKKQIDLLDIQYRKIVKKEGN